MNKFTYEDYIKYSNFLKEEGEIYDTYDNSITQSKDKTYKIIFSSKKEVAIFINYTLKLYGTKSEVKEKNLIKCNTNFITPNFKSRQADVVYKLKNKKVFFLIEHQSKIDYSMPYRILEYCLSIMQNDIDKNKVTRKDYRLPIICPIVLYTGKTKWNQKRYLKDCQEKWRGYYNKEFTN